MSALDWLVVLAVLLMISFVASLAITVLVLLPGALLVRLVRRHREHRLAARREQRRLAEQVNDSITQLQTAYWQTQQRLRDEASRR